ncbi:helix-hairpin-helix domain-containing protein, partial [Desulforudis sp. 1190]
MHNKKVAEILRWVGELLEIKGENPFKVRAYYKAAEKVAHLGEDVAQFAARGALTGIPGIGKDLAAKITEIIETGKLEYYERLTEEIPPGILQLLAVPGIGPKKALALFKELNVRSLEDLEAAAKSEKIRHLKGFQERTEKNILRGIESARRSRARHPIGEMLPFAMALVEALRRRAPA